MARLKVYTYPDTCLLTKADPVEKVDTEICRLLDDMLETMYANDGCGISGNQVGILKRVAVIDVARENEDPRPIKMINPEIYWASEKDTAIMDGCLSVPNYWAETWRPDELKVRYLDEKGKLQDLHANGLLAKCIHHEIDHLNGILFIQHVSPLKRKMIVRKLLRDKKRQRT